MDSTKPNETSVDDAKIKSDLFNLVEKLQIELQKKHEELQKKDQELQKKDQELQKKDEELLEKEEKLARKNQEYVAHLTVELDRENQLNAFLKGLAKKTQQINHVLWKSFPFPDLTYYIKMQSGLQNGQFHYLYVESNIDYLRSSAGDQPQCEFKFAKNSDGSFTIYSMGRSLRTDANSSRVGFAGNDGSAEKFVLFFHPQNKQAGLLVDISSMVGSFLCVDNHCLTANSRTPPANKFLILPVGVE